MSKTIEYPVQNPVTLYVTEGLRNAVLILEERDYNLEKITQFTSQYLQTTGFRARAPMVVGIGASKGGIGKSTIALNLGHAFARAGLKTGVVDTDLCDPNDGLYVHNDAGLELDENENVRFDGRGNLIDVVFGRKIEGRKRLARKTLDQVGYPSVSDPNVTYFLSEQLGESYGERGDSAKALQDDQKTLLQQARRLKEFDVIVLDFPAGTPEYLSAYMGCDERGYVVDYGNDASFSGIQNIARLVARKRMDGDNFLIVNCIPQYENRETLEDILNRLSSRLARAIRLLGDDCYMREAKRVVPRTNDLLKRLGLAKLAFTECPAFLRDLDIVRESSNRGIPYLAALNEEQKRRMSYSKQLFNLATNMVAARLEKTGGSK